MKVTLSLPERNALNQMLAQHTGDMGTLRVVREAREELDYTDEEIEQWAEPCDISPRCKRGECQHRNRDFVFPKSLVKLVTTKLRSMNDGKQLTIGLYSLVEKFCPELVDKEKDDAPAPACNGEAEAVKAGV